MKHLKLILPVLLIAGVGLLISASIHPKNPGHEKEIAQKPSRVILFVIDGLGIGQIQATRIQHGKLNLDDFQNIGFHTPHSEIGFVPSTTSAATQLACGVVSTKNAVGLDKGGQETKNLLQIAHENEMAGALITTGLLCEATPLAFLGSIQDVTDKYKAAKATSKTNAEFLLGGGRTYYAGDDNNEPIIEWFTSKGFKYHSKLKDNPKRIRGDKKLILTEPFAMPSATRERGNVMSQSWLASFHHFVKKGSGYFTVLHNTQLNAFCQSNSAQAAIAEVVDIDKAIGEVMKIVKLSGGTLVLVTGTHESGGMTVLDYNANNEPNVKWACKSNTRQMVPVYAYGTGSENFKGNYTTVELHNKLKELISK